MLTWSLSFLNLQTTHPWCSTPMPFGDPQRVHWTAPSMNQCFPLPPKLGRIDLHPIHSKRLPTEIPMCIWVAPILLSFEVQWALSFYLERAPEQHYTSSQMSLSRHPPPHKHIQTLKLDLMFHPSELWIECREINIYGVTDKQLLSLTFSLPMDTRKRFNRRRKSMN